MLPALCILAGLCGCGDDFDAFEKSCESVCERSKECQPGREGIYCYIDCGNDGRDYAMMGCTSEAAAYLACVDALDNVCVLTSVACRTEQDAFSFCALRYCQAHPEEESCSNTPTVGEIS